MYSTTESVWKKLFTILLIHLLKCFQFQYSPPEPGFSRVREGQAYV